MKADHALGFSPHYVVAYFLELSVLCDAKRARGKARNVLLTVKIQDVALADIRESTKPTCKLTCVVLLDCF